LSDPEALLPRVAPLPTDTLDLGARHGKIVFALGTAFLGLAVCALRAHVPQLTFALPLASAVLIPVFVTGTRAQLMPTPIELAGRVLRPARDALSTTIDLSHVEIGTIGRVVSGPDQGVDEVRLVCSPHDRMPGLRTIELALAPSGDGAIPEVLVRFDEGSAAGERMARVTSDRRGVSGRTAQERVVRLVPDEPTPSAAAALVGRLLLCLEGRRATDRHSPSGTRPRWRGIERRLALASGRLPVPRGSGAASSPS
jgi:hypothetical protein